MIVLGLTGSIGMGKSTVAVMFREFGVPVFDSDASVHRLYAADGAATPLVEAAFPGTTGPAGVDRQKLSAAVLGDAAALKRLEALVHPLVKAAQDQFRQDAMARDEPLIVFDIPLLYEGGGEKRVDRVAVVSAPAHIQEARVLARANMDAAKFAAILAKQVPDAEKRRRADYIIPTGGSFDETRAAVRTLIDELRAQVQQSRAQKDR